MRKYSSVLAFMLLMVTGLTAGGQMPSDLTKDLKAERLKYGTLINQTEAGALINAVANKNRTLGYGLLRKDSGNNCPVEGLSFRVSCDWIVNINVQKGCDVLAGGPDPEGPGPSTPQWCDGEPFDTSRFVQPVGTDQSLEQKVAELEILVAKTMQERDRAQAVVTTVTGERDAAQAALADVQPQLEAARVAQADAIAQRDAAQAALANVRCEGYKLFGTFRLPCKVIRP